MVCDPNHVSSYRLLPIGRLQLFFFEDFGATKTVEAGSRRTVTVAPTKVYIMCANGRHRYEYMRIGWQLGIYLHVYWTRGHIFGDCLKSEQKDHKNIRYHIFLCKLKKKYIKKKKVANIDENIKHVFFLNMIFLMIVKNTHLCMRDFVCERHTQRCFVCYMR